MSIKNLEVELQKKADELKQVQGDVTRIRIQRNDFKQRLESEESIRPQLQHEKAESECAPISALPSAIRG